MLIRGINVPFTTYKSPKTGKTEHGSLTGVAWKHLFRGIGPALRSSDGVLQEGKKVKFAELFEGFSNILEFVAACAPSDANAVADMTRDWARRYTKMKFSVTPYVHMVATHFPMSVKLFGGLNKLNGEWVEAANDSIKRLHLQRTARKCPKQTLMMQRRNEHHETNKR